METINLVQVLLCAGAQVPCRSDTMGTILIKVSCIYVCELSEAKEKEKEKDIL